MRVSTLMVSILITQLSWGQHHLSETYFSLSKKADSLYQAQSYSQAAVTYTQAFKAGGWVGQLPEMYGAARAWARVGNLDSAFRKIDRVMTYGSYQDKQKVSAEPAFQSLQQDKRWQTLVVDRLAKLGPPPDTRLDQALVARLDTIFREDQHYRLLIEGVGQKHGFESKEMKELWEKIAAVDSVNVTKVKAILAKHGWLGPEVVGEQGNNTLFLVIQHADPATQVAYLPMMRQAVKAGKAQASQLALLEDRVALSQGRMQIYGSQIMRDEKAGKYFVQPIEDPDNVNNRRKSVGLPSIEEYVKRWDIIWDAQEHKKQQRKQ